MKSKLILSLFVFVLVWASTASAVRRSDHSTFADNTLIVVLEVEGVVMGTFDSVDGMDSETEVIEFQDGNDPLVLKRPGRVRYHNIILTKGELLSDDLWDWYQTVVSGSFDRKNGSVIIRTRNGQELVRYNFYSAWPCSWKGVSLGISEDEDLAEEIQLAVDRIDRLKGSGDLSVNTALKTIK